MNHAERAKEQRKAVCLNCGKQRDEHRLVNFSEGQIVNEAFLVCPTATYKARAEEKP